ncbi:hypothetical protein DVH05_008245 [Phytophthora capsici]|nr:hypothetical protein DVH05_008245 [Phytophthora capsici]
MGFLQKVKTCKHISLSLGSVAINRDLRAKFDRLELKRAYAYENEGRSIAFRAACTSMYNTPHLVRFHIIGVEISPEVLPLLAKALFHGQELEDVSLNGTNLGDKGLEAIAIALGRCPKLHLISLAGCSLTDNAKDHIAKIISLHGVIKDEAIWSSSLRGEVPDPPLPDLLINLSRNNLGDEAAEAICDALYNDKWLLGLNLGGNHLSQQGTELLISTLTKSNLTLAVLALANMRNPVGSSTLATLDSILHPRDRYLQQMATESREKRMALGSLLLEWGIDKEKVVEICYLESSGKDGAKAAATAPKQLTLASPKGRVDRVYPRSTSGNNVSRVSNQDSNNSNSGEENGDDDDDEVEVSTAASHVKTIEYLIERLSALEAERRKIQEYVEKVEAENRQLRAELEGRANAAPGISAIEAQIIAQLETSISSLAEQVEIMEHEKQQNPPSTLKY